MNLLLLLTTLAVVSGTTVDCFRYCRQNAIGRCNTVCSPDGSCENMFLLFETGEALYLEYEPDCPEGMSVVTCEFAADNFKRRRNALVMQPSQFRRNQVARHEDGEGLIERVEEEDEEDEEDDEDEEDEEDDEEEEDEEDEEDDEEEDDEEEEEEEEEEEQDDVLENTSEDSVAFDGDYTVFHGASNDSDSSSDDGSVSTLILEHTFFENAVNLEDQVVSVHVGDGIEYIRVPSSMEFFADGIEILVSELRGTLYQILSFPFKPYLCGDDNYDAIFAVVSNLPTQGITRELSDWIQTIPTIQLWKQAIGTLLATLFNEPTSLTAFAEKNLIMYDIFVKKCHLALDVDDSYIEIISKSVPSSMFLKNLIAPGNRHLPWLCPACRYPGISLPGLLALEPKGSLWVQHVMEFVASTDEPIPPESCTPLIESIFTAYSLEPLPFECKTVLSFLARSCAEFADFDPLHILLARHRTLFPVEDYPVRALTVASQTAITLNEAIELLCPLEKVDFVRPDSPRIAFRDSPALGMGPRVEWLVAVLANTQSMLIPSDEREVALKPILIPSELPKHQKTHILQNFNQLGRIIGMAIREGIPIRLPLTPACISILVGRHKVVLESTQKIWWKFEDIEAFSNFSKLQPDSLVGMDFPGDDLRVVDSSNLREFITASMEWRIFSSVEDQMTALLGGIYDIIPFGSLSYYSMDKLATLFRGNTDTIDVAALRSSTKYIPQTSADCNKARWFWETLESYSQEELGMFLKFVSSSPLPPVTGFGPDWFKLVLTSSAPNFLPHAQTCFKELHLPGYRKKKQLVKKLTYAIKNTNTMENV